MLAFKGEHSCSAPPTLPFSLIWRTSNPAPPLGVVAIIILSVLLLLCLISVFLCDSPLGMIILLLLVLRLVCVFLCHCPLGIIVERWTWDPWCKQWSSGVLRYTHKAEIRTDESTQRLIQKDRKIPCPATTRSRTLATAFAVQCISQRAKISS